VIVTKKLLIIARNAMISFVNNALKNMNAGTKCLCRLSIHRGWENVVTQEIWIVITLKLMKRTNNKIIMKYSYLSKIYDKLYNSNKHLKLMDKYLPLYGKNAKVLWILKVN